MSKLPKHILVIRLSAMGDVAMTIPVLKAFTTQHPHIKLTVLTRPFFKPFFRDLNNTTVFCADFKHDYKGVLGIFKLHKTLKQIPFDAVADLHNVLRTQILKRLINKPFIQINKGRLEKKALIKGKIFEPLKTTHQRYADVFKKLGYPIDLQYSISATPVNLNTNIKLLTGNKTLKWIGIAPMAAYEGKIYPLHLMKQVVQTLSKQYKVFLFGGVNDKDTLDVMVVNNAIVNLAGRFNLHDEMNIISNLDVMLSMDSGNAHIAAMMGIPVITIWGVTHPYCGFSPFGQPEENALISNRNIYPLIPTSVYGNKYPESYRNASSSITVDTVVKTIIFVLKEEV